MTDFHDRHHWAERAIADCQALNVNAVRGTNCCTACREHHEIDMGWLKHKEMDRKPGTPGVFIILADATGSISPVNKRRIVDEALSVLSRNPQARLIAFGSSICDITGDPSRLSGITIWECFDGIDLENPRKVPAHGTYIGRALAYAAKYNPERVDVLSDGGTADRREMLRIADNMTGQINAWYCHPVRSEFNLDHHFIKPDELWRHYSRGADKATMQELARRGGGRFGLFPSNDGAFNDYGIRDTSPMRQTKHFSKGGNVHIDGPAERVEHVHERIRVVRHRHVEIVDGEQIITDNSTPGDVSLQLGGSTVNYDSAPAIETHHKPRGLLKTLLLGPERQQYRGELRAAPSAPALPAPSDQPLIVTSHFSKSKVAR